MSDLLCASASVRPEPPGVLCYVSGYRAFFTTAPLGEQWGDDWNDAPYEHNAGTPYEEKGFALTCVLFDAGELVTPDYEQYNSPWSVEQINSGATPWLQSSVYSNGNIFVMAGASFREFQTALLAAGGTALAPWPPLSEGSGRSSRMRTKTKGPHHE